MKLFSMTELANRTRAELAALQEAIQTELLGLTEGTDEYAIAEANLDSIRVTLARRSLMATRRFNSPAL